MASTSQDLIQAIQGVQTVEEIHAVCAQLCENYGYDHFLYAAMIPTSFVKPYRIIISGYPSQWRDHYTESEYDHVDPTVSYCASHSTPLLWSQVDRLPLGPVSRKARTFMEDAQDFGLRDGVSIPVHSLQGDRGMFSLSSDEEPARAASRISATLADANLFSLYLHEAVLRVFSQQELPLGRVHLTDREQECLLWASEGKTAWETSQILRISERTVTYHLQNAADKMQVSNRQQAVARAIGLGLIVPQI